MSCLAVIAAVGDSTKVPRSLLTPLAGKPLIAHTIETALAAKRVTRVVVSTDDAEIEAVARRYGAEVVQRPTDISGDRASSESAVLHSLATLAEREGYAPELVTMLQCTSPLTIAEDIDGAVDALVQQHADSCFTAVPFHYYLWSTGPDGVATGVNHSGAKRQRRQDVPPQWLENGAVYVMRVAPFTAAGDRFCGKVVAHVVDEARALEIDEPIDFVKAEAAMAAMGRSRRIAELPSHVAAVVFDFDGVLTDNRVLVLEDGREAVFCDRGDGMGFGIVQALGIELLILSKERNPVVGSRAKKLNVACLQGIDDKASALERWASERDIKLEDVVYVGNDINDVACMKMVGCAVCPADAHPQAKRVADIELQASGGRGAVRELCDLLAAGR